MLDVAVAFGSLNFKSQRAERKTIDGRTGTVVVVWVSFCAPPSSSVFQSYPDDESGSFRIFLPLLSPPLPFFWSLMSASFSCSCGRSEASTAIMQNNYRGMRSAVPRHTDVTCSLIGHVRTCVRSIPSKKFIWYYMCNYKEYFVCLQITIFYTFILFITSISIKIKLLFF